MLTMSGQPRIDATEVRVLRAAGWTLKRLGERYDVTKSAVSLYLKRSRSRVNRAASIVPCAQCGVSVSVVAERRKRKHHFCSSDCYHAWYPVPTAMSWRHGQRLARAAVTAAGHVLLPGPLVPHRYTLGEMVQSQGHVVHHVDGDHRNNELMNLWVFASNGDHQSWHRGGVGRPIWRGDGMPCGEQR